MVLGIFGNVTAAAAWRRWGAGLGGGIRGAVRTPQGRRPGQSAQPGDPAARPRTQKGRLCKVPVTESGPRPPKATSFGGLTGAARSQRPLPSTPMPILEKSHDRFFLRCKKGTGLCGCSGRSISRPLTAGVAPPAGPWDVGASAPAASPWGSGPCKTPLSAPWMMLMGIWLRGSIVWTTDHRAQE